MAVFLHHEEQFDKLLSNLCKAGGKAALAAMRDGIPDRSESYCGAGAG